MKHSWKQIHPCVLHPQRQKGYPAGGFPSSNKVASCPAGNSRCSLIPCEVPFQCLCSLCFCLTKTLLHCRFLPLHLSPPLLFPALAACFSQGSAASKEETTSLWLFSSSGFRVQQFTEDTLSYVNHSQTLKKKSQTTDTRNNTLMLSIQILCKYHLFLKHFKEL